MEMMTFALVILLLATTGVSGFDFKHYDITPECRQLGPKCKFIDEAFRALFDDGEHSKECIPHEQLDNKSPMIFYYNESWLAIVLIYTDDDKIRIDYDQKCRVWEGDDAMAEVGLFLTRFVTKTTLSQVVFSGNGGIDEMIVAKLGIDQTKPNSQLKFSAEDVGAVLLKGRSEYTFMFSTEHSYFCKLFQCWDFDVNKLDLFLIQLLRTKHISLSTFAFGLLPSDGRVFSPFFPNSSDKSVRSLSVDTGSRHSQHSEKSSSRKNSSSDKKSSRKKSDSSEQLSPKNLGSGKKSSPKNSSSGKKSSPKNSGSGKKSSRKNSVSLSFPDFTFLGRWYSP